MGQVSKVKWTVDGRPKLTAKLLMDLVDTITKDIRMFVPARLRYWHRGELTNKGLTDAFLQLLRLRDYDERYLME